jgi:hypothetical protein
MGVLDMKVWMCKRTVGYSGGLAVVAANSKKSAIKTFFSDEKYSYMASEVEGVIHYWAYKPEDWFECKELVANVDKPCVIMEDGYTE